MKLTRVDSLASIEALMAFEEQIDGSLASRIPALKPFFVTPFETRCTSNGITHRIWVFARNGSTVLFASLGTASFGVGALADLQQVSGAQHFPTIEIAANRFLGTIKQAE
jgi:hypothetical protein